MQHGYTYILPSYEVSALDVLGQLISLTGQALPTNLGPPAVCIKNENIKVQMYILVYKDFIYYATKQIKHLVIHKLLIILHKLHNSALIVVINKKTPKMSLKYSCVVLMTSLERPASLILM